MQTTERPIAISNPTLQVLIHELGQECQQVIILLNQLQLPDLNPTQQANILAELLTSSIHLHAHCDETFQDRLSDALESLPDTDAADSIP
ncbi:MAG: hypothetical protein VKJ24_14420 [Synechococcales bacterium]|nr:hypothetical protein [Synechococcales bacterium]